MTHASKMHELVQSVTTIVQQHGQHDFPSYATEDQVRTATLCGLTVFIENGRVIRIQARDMEMVFDRGANDEHVVALSRPVYSFLQGGLIELERWHNRLMRFQTVFGFTPHAIADQA